MSAAETQNHPTPQSGRNDLLWRSVLGEELRAMRRQRNETLETVARRANVSVQYLSEVERGRKEASSEVIAALADALGATLLDLAAGVVDRLQPARAVGHRSSFSLAA